MASLTILFLAGVHVILERFLFDQRHGATGVGTQGPSYPRALRQAFTQPAERLIITFFSTAWR